MYATEGTVTSAQKLGFIMRSLNIKPTILELSQYYEKYKKDGILDIAHFKIEYLKNLKSKFVIKTTFRWSNRFCGLFKYTVCSHASGRC